jgi:hypothetical protein
MPKKIDFSHICDKWIIEEYVTKRRSLKEMCVILKISEATFVRLLKERNIKKAPEDLSGQTFNRWNVIKLDKRDINHDSKWICKCECGKIKSVYAGSLKSGQTKSCGCWNKESSRKRGQDRAYNSNVHGNLINQIIWGADRRNIERPESRQKLRELIESQYIKQNGKCSLTGEDLYFDNKNDIGNIVYGSGNLSVDRIDSSKGYIEGNIQLVKKWVNISKNSMSQQEFIESCRKVVDYADGKHNEQ